MFKCKVCQEKDRTIAVLEAEVKVLSSLLMPQPIALTSELIEADDVLSGKQGDPEPLPPTDEDKAARIQELLERDQLLSGNY